MNPWEKDWDTGKSQATPAPSTPSDFTKTYAPAAEKAGKALGVDPQVLLGQWGLETGWGKSIIPGTNNLGNIKDFSGSGTSAKDNMTGSTDKYRQYASPEAFADDYVSLVQRKYPDAVGAKDPQAFASALKAGGYAEDPRYVDKVVQATRMAGTKQNPVLAAAGKVADAIIPSAQAAESQKPWEKNWAVPPKPAAPEPSTADAVQSGAGRFFSAAAQGTKDLAAGAVRGAGSIGATLLAPVDMASDALAGKGLSLDANRQRRADMDAALQSLGANTNSLSFQAGKLGGEIAGTAGMGSVLGAGAKAVGAAPKIVNALQSGGLTLGGAPAKTLAEGAGNLLTRAGAGAATGAASAGLVNPEDAKTGAIVGGALPVGVAALGTAGNALGRSLTGSGVSPEVKALADRAKQLGIDIPADRLVNSKPLNALAASLEYVPLSGRAGTMNKMEDQLNTAVSRTFGQDSPNVTQALRKAGNDLGQKFDTVLQNNKVTLDNQFRQDLTDATSMANKELGPEGAKIIGNQVDEILAKAGQTGEIDGQAAYNIKKTLDRIGQRNSNEAYYALDLKQKLMDALNRSLGPAEADAFKTVRQQYGNMIAMEKIAQNGAEGGVSIARLANMKNINNPDLQELADISAQFLKSRESSHGAAQRVFGGMGAGATAALAATLGHVAVPVGIAAGMAGGRGANMLLNSNAARSALLGAPQTNLLLQGIPSVGQGLARAAPVAISDR